MTSKLTRERIQRIIRTIDSEAYDEEEIREWLSSDEIMELSRMALAAMDSSESVEMPLDYLQGHKDGLEWAAQLAEANHPETGDWLYDDPIELAKAIRKGPDMPPAQPAADSEPVAYIFKHPAGRLFWSLTDESNKGQSDVMPVYAAPQTAVDWESGCKERNLFCSTDTARMRKAISASAGTEAAQLYRHAQQPVVPDDVLAALQKVARIRLDLNDFDGDRRGIADCLGDAEEALIEVVNRRAVMLAAVPQEVKGE